MKNEYVKNKKSNKTLKIITDYEFKLNIKALNINSFITFIGYYRLNFYGHIKLDVFF